MGAHGSDARSPCSLPNLMLEPHCSHTLFQHAALHFAFLSSQSSNLHHNRSLALTSHHITLPVPQPPRHFSLPLDHHTHHTHLTPSQAKPENKEFSMGIASVSDTFGISVAGFCSIYMHNYICQAFIPDWQVVWY